jgi:hypothetical protein
MARSGFKCCALSCLETQSIRQQGDRSALRGAAHAPLQVADAPLA